MVRYEIDTKNYDYQELYLLRKDFNKEEYIKMIIEARKQRDDYIIKLKSLKEKYHNIIKEVFEIKKYTREQINQLKKVMKICDNIYNKK